MSEENQDLGNQGNPGDGGENQAPTTYSMEDFKTSQWREAISDEATRTHGAMANFKSIDDLANSWKNAQKFISSEKVALPKEDDADAWNEVYNKLGRPENPDLYEFKLPENSPDHWTGESFKAYENEFKKNAHDAGLSRKQAEAQWNFVQNKALSGVTAQTNQQQAFINSNVDLLKQEYGAALPSAINKRDAIINKFGGPEVLEMMKGDPGLNTSPKIMKMFNEIAKNFGEDVILEATMNPGGQLSPSEAQSKVNAMLSDKNGPYKDRKHPDHTNAVKEFSRLVQQAKGRK